MGGRSETARFRPVHVLAALMFCAVLLPTGGLRSETAAQTPDLAEPVAVGRSVDNPRFTLAVIDFRLATEKLGEPAPAGSLYLIVNATVTNRSAEEPLVLPAVEQSFFLSTRDVARVAPHELSRDTAQPFWGEITLAPGEERPAEIVFAVPAALPEAVSLSYDGPTGAVSLAVTPDAVAAPAGVCGDRETRIDQAAENAALGLRIEGFCLVEKIGEQPAAAEKRVLVVRGEIANAASGAVGMGPVSGLLRLQLAAGVTVDADPISDTALSSGFDQRFEAGDKRRFEAAFLVPAEVPEATVVHPGAAGILAIPLIVGEKRQGAGIASAEVDGLRVTALAVELGAAGERPSASAGGTSVAVALKVEASGGVPLVAALGDFAVLLEDGAYARAPLPGSGPASLTQDATIYPSLPVEGELLFEVDDPDSDLQLVMFGASGPVRLDLTPDRTPSPAPAPIAGPHAGGAFTAALLGWRAKESQGEGNAAFVADVSVALDAGPLDYLPFDPAERLALVDRDGTIHRPVEDSSADHPLRAGPLWSGQPIRGEVAFVLPVDAAAGLLSLKVLASDPAIDLPIGQSGAAAAAEAAPETAGADAQAGAAETEAAATEPPPSPPSPPPGTPSAVSLVIEPDPPPAKQPILVRFSNMAGKAGDWIAVARAGSPDDSYLAEANAGGAVSGEVSLPAQPPGDYEIRAYFDWPAGGYTVQARLPFRIERPVAPFAGQLLSLARRTIREGQPITVLWRGFRGESGDYVALAEAAAPDDASGIPYVYTDGRPEGRSVFAGQKPGNYEFRAYFAGTNDIQDRLAFTVEPRAERVAEQVPEPDNPALAGLTDVALRTRGAFAQAGAEWELLLDGDAADYDYSHGYSNLVSDRPNRIWLAEPKPIERVRFLLWDGDKRTYRYRLLGSPDGVEWRTLQDTSDTPVAGGWQEVLGGGQNFLAFAFETTATDAQDGLFPVVEFAAYSNVPEPSLPDLGPPPVEADPPAWQDAAPPAPVNVAQPALGATPMAENSPDALIDASRTDDSRAESSLGQPLSVTFDRSYPIDRIVVALRESEYRTYRYRIEGSEDGEQWTLIADRSDSDRSGTEETEAGGRPLKAIRVIGTAASDGGALAIRDIQAFTSGPVPVTSVAEPFEAMNEAAYGNLALLSSGGRVEAATSEADTVRDALHLIDGSLAGDWVASAPTLPQSAVLSFPGRNPAAFDGIDLYAGRGGAQPKIVDVAVPDGASGWIRIGRFGLVTAPVQRLRFPTVVAPAVRISVIATYDETSPVAIAELAIREAQSSAAASPLPYRRTDFEGGLNIAAAALGGRLERANVADPDPNYGPALLVDGFALDRGYWAPESDYAVPELVLSFAGGQSALIGGVAVSPNGGCSNFTGCNRWTSLFEVWASNESPTGGFARIGRYRLDQADRTQVFAFEPVQARFVRLLLVDTYGAWGAVLGEVEVLEASRPGYRSILADNPPNLLDYRFGGHVAVPRGERRTDLIDSTTATPGWSADASSLPVTVTFGFEEGQSRRIGAIGFNPKTDADPSTWVQQVKVLVSDHPVRDFTPLGDFTLRPEDIRQDFTFPAVSARFVQVRILATAGSAGTVSLGDVFAREALTPSELSAVARRVHPLPEEDSEAAAVQAQAVAAVDVRETEPNDSEQAATPLPLAKLAAGRIAPLSDVDWYEVDTSAAQVDGLNVSISESPILRVALALFDGAGRAIAEQPLYERGTDRAELSWRVPRGRHLVRVSRPQNSIVFIVDRSGSVSDVRGQIAAAAETFARNVEPDEAISFATMDGEVLNDFSNDPAMLVAAARATQQGEGGSGVYASLVSAIERLSARPGAKAIVIVTDGEDSGSSAEPLYQLWDVLAATGVRIYTVGYGTKIIEPLDGDLGSTGGDMLRSFSRATGGRFFRAPSGAAMLGLYDTIAADLRGDSAYLLKAAAPSGLGGIEVVETGEPITGVSAPSQVELIMDASGSMRAKMADGMTRMTTARQVLHEVIDNLPEGTEVALRVYGHRLPREPKDASCGDSQLVIPFGPLDRALLHGAVEAITPQGQTPIGLSLAQLPNDFGEAPGGKVVIVVTDGIETCDPEPGDPNFPPRVVSDLIAQGVSVRVNVVGFEIGESETRAFLSEIAAAGNGSYYDASGAEELTAALAEAVKAEFAVRDSAGQEVARGKVGGLAVNIPDGRWRVVLATDPERDLGEVTVNPAQVTRIEIAKEGNRFAASVQP